MSRPTFEDSSGCKFSPVICSAVWSPHSREKRCRKINFQVEFLEEPVMVSSLYFENKTMHINTQASR